MNGLPTNFSLQNGAFVLTGGETKAIDRLWFLMNFNALRVYMAGFAPGLEQLQQRPASFLVQFRNIILGNLMGLITAYVPEISVDTTDIVVSRTDRKQYGIFLQYHYTPAQTTGTTVIFVG